VSATLIRLDPEDARAHYILGWALRKKGEYAESLAEFRRGHELGSKRPGWPLPSAASVREGERLVSLSPRLRAVLVGDDRPADSTEGIAFGQLAYYSKVNAASARLYAEAFAADPKLADDLKTDHRQNAACSAALAGTGMGVDDPPPGEAGRAKLRQQAQDWLRADLVLRRQQLDTGTHEARSQVRAKLQHWEADRDLAGVHDPEVLNKLSEEERQAWRAFWGEVDTLLAKAQGDPP
jgi:hypothetical protein